MTSGPLPTGPLYRSDNEQVSADSQGAADRPKEAGGTLDCLNVHSLQDLHFIVSERHGGGGVAGVVMNSKGSPKL